MRIEQALYGESRGGHALLVASGNLHTARELTSRLDLPDTAPPGVEWSPFLSGFPHGDQYVVAMTSLDVAATRAGMVFSHALIAPLDQIVRVRNLRPLLAPFKTVVGRPSTLDGVEIELEENAPSPQAADLAGAAGALSIRAVGPVVRLGHIGFDDLVVALWARLWPEIRCGFAFRLSFGPSDLVETPQPAIVCTPRSLAARWIGYRVIGVADHQNASPLAAALLRGDEEKMTLLSFAQTIGASITNFADLSLLEQAYRFGSGSSQPIEHVVTALRLMERLSPTRAVGRDGKANLLTQLRRHLATATPEQVLSLRNLTLSAVDGPEDVWQALTRWIEQNRYVAHQDDAMLAVLENATTGERAVAGWRSAVLAGILAASRLREPPIAAAFWRWAKARPEMIGDIFRSLAADDSVEQAFADAAPARLDPGAAGVVAKASLSRQWLEMHAAAVSAAYRPLQAVEMQLAVDSGPASLQGLRKALRHASAADKLACALTLDEPRLDLIAAEAAAADPALLVSIDTAALPAQRIWALALASNHHAWRGPENPQNAFWTVLDGLMEGRPTHQPVIDELSTSPLADLSLYPRRESVWTYLSADARANFLVSTASGWLSRVQSGPVLFRPDRVLQAAILSRPALDAVLADLVPTRIGAATELVSTLDEFDEGRFITWLRKVVSSGVPLSEADAEAIGRLTSNRQWSQVAEELAAAARFRSDLFVALRICCPLLGLWTRLRLGLSRVSSAEKWNLLEEAATELYPRGPDDAEIWDRAGGKNSDLQHIGSGRSRWHDALGRLRRGDRVKIDRLIREMRQDYPNNEKLQYLSNDREFGGGLP